MANTKNKNTVAYKNKLIYIREYNKKSPRISIQFNAKTEADMIEWLNDKSKATYIKELIKKDMERNGK
jgi:hypothetical protein